MAPKRTASSTASPAPSSSSPAAASPTAVSSSTKPSSAAGSSKGTHTRSKSSHSSNSKNAGPQGRLEEAWGIVERMWERYTEETPVRVLCIDAFMGFLIVVGVVQFLYCLLVSAYPFNAFLAGFSACVGQFVLTASLRMQTNPENRKAFEGQQPGDTSGSTTNTHARISDERAFADYVFGSLVLHFFCVNFMN